MSGHGVIKVIISFYCLDSDTAFERHRSRIAIINEVKAVEPLKKTLDRILGIEGTFDQVRPWSF